MKKKLLLMLNPHAGKAEVKNKLLDIVDLFVKAGYDVTVRPTQRRLEIPDILRDEAAQFDLVVCCGGDGTLNETISGLMQNGQKRTIGYIPTGTVNDFATSLHLSKNMLVAAETIIKGFPFSCDVGQFGDRYFSYVAAFGAFTEVSYQTPQEFKNFLGRTAYILEGVKRLANLASYHVRFDYDDEVIEDDFLLGLITNSYSVGGFRFISQDRISMCDGKMEVLLVKTPHTLSERFAIVNALLHQRIDPEVMYFFNASKVKVHTLHEIAWTLDGEYGGSWTDVEVASVKQAVDILVDTKVK
ncbi:diacylglycerol kinase family protein [Neobittarella massiliensis]|uniref:Diacylglycerol kinase family lipid kinase n=2 Tax=Oscillospiraceae TaxID=216572 RepID=A0A8J6LYH1_9FIRM|nr:diacylglycerol kinase family protein [Neobittarella massiliensis]MBC3515462.1 diacylglycerol kinase family lipid kinase [Neobittarella massiliensis]SCJ56541.1 Diacylglycerol kinase [uncultured Anaerotruncus sp.]